MTRPGPLDIIPDGTEIRLAGSEGTFKGTVAGSRIVPASNGGMIALHTLTLTHRWKFQPGKTRKEWVALPAPKTVSPNYSFITIP